MTTHKEALTLALEAIHDLEGEINGYRAVDFPIPEKAKAAIKEALAQPEHHTLTSRVNDVRFHKERDEQRDEAMKMLAQPEQEPVAKVCHDLDGHIGWNPKLTQLPDEGTHLYTTPYVATPLPQRQCNVKPLTDEQIDSFREANSEGRGAGWRFNFKGFARAIEAAHGIKGEA